MSSTFISRVVLKLIACGMLLTMVAVGCGKTNTPATYHDKSAVEWANDFAVAQDSQTRIEALIGIRVAREGLSYKDHEAVAKQILPAVLDKDVDVSELVVDVLARLDAPALLVQTYKDENASPDLRSQLARVFGMMGEDAPDVIFNALWYSLSFDAEDRVDLVAVAQALGRSRSQPDQAVNALRTRLALVMPMLKPASGLTAGAGNPLPSGLPTAEEVEQIFAHLHNVLLAEALVAALERYEEKAHSATFLLTMALSTEIAPRAEDALRKIGESAIVPLLVLLQDTDAAYRLTALRIISHILGDNLENLKPERPFLIGRVRAMALAEPSALVRQQIAHSLGEIKWPSKPVLEALVPLLSDKDAAVRQEAATCILTVSEIPHSILQVTVDDIRGLVSSDEGADIAVILLSGRPDREVLAMMEQAGFDQDAARIAYRKKEAMRRAAKLQDAPMIP